MMRLTISCSPLQWIHVALPTLNWLLPRTCLPHIPSKTPKRATICAGLVLIVSIMQGSVPLLSAALLRKGCTMYVSNQQACSTCSGGTTSRVLGFIRALKTGCIHLKDIPQQAPK